jgi:NAD(P)-dependent dehydrogenase (short-subunit alcohol dehydrogenase family)
MRLRNKTALVIGSGTGIGRAVAEAFAAEGARVAAADRGHVEERRQLVRTMLETAPDAFDIECDVLIETDVQKAIDATIARFGHIDILVNNAGVGTRVIPFATQEWDEWDRVLNINLRGTAYGMKHVLPHMLARKSGRIINTASQLAHKPAPGYGVYCASKAAIVGLTVSVAHEVAAEGVTVNCVCPGPTDTPAWRASDPRWNEWKIGQLPIKRIGSPREIASAYVYLASDEASYMIGQSVSPNGGDVSW